MTGLSYRAWAYQGDHIMVDIEIESLFNQQKWQELRSLLTTRPAPEVTERLSAVTKTRRVLLYNVLSSSQSFEVFSYLEPDIQDSL